MESTNAKVMASTSNASKIEQFNEIVTGDGYDSWDVVVNGETVEITILDGMATFVVTTDGRNMLFMYGGDGCLGDLNKEYLEYLYGTMTDLYDNINEINEVFCFNSQPF